MGFSKNFMFIERERGTTTTTKKALFITEGKAWRATKGEKVSSKTRHSQPFVSSETPLQTTKDRFAFVK